MALYTINRRLADLESQVQACETTAFGLHRIDQRGERVDTLPQAVADLRETIDELTRVLARIPR